MLEGTYQLKHEFKKIKILFNIFVLLNVFHVLTNHSWGLSNFITSFIHIGILLGFFFLYNKTFNKLNYSFWTFSFGLGVYLAYNLFFYWGTGNVYLVILMILLFMSICYGISSPLFYPRVHWWEYDFRYKGDLKIWVSYQDKQIEGRLYDLRRGAGCVTLFEKIHNGETILISFKFKEEDFSFHSQVVTVKSNIIGRGFIHGVKMKFADKVEEKAYKQLSKNWREFIRNKVKEKADESNK